MNFKTKSTKESDTLENKINLNDIEIVNGMPDIKPKKKLFEKPAGYIPEESKDEELKNIESKKSSGDKKDNEIEIVTDEKKKKFAWATTVNKFTIGLTVFIAISMPITGFLLGLNYGKSLLNSKDTSVNIIHTGNNIVKIGDYDIELNPKPLFREDLNVFRYTSNTEYSSNYQSNMFKTNVDMDNEIKYYEVGRFNTGKYEDYKLVYGFSKDYNYSTNRIPVVLAIYDSQYVVFNTVASKDKDNKEYKYTFVPNAILQPNDLKETDTSIYSFIQTPLLSLDKVTTSANYGVALYPILDDSQFDKSIVDTKKNQTYLLKTNKEGGVFIKTVDGFYQADFIDPKFDIAKINWSKGDKTVKDTYTYKSIGGCFRNNLEVVNINFDVIQTGKTDDGQDIYEAKDPNKDLYMKELYEQDYIQNGIYKVNSFLDDDKKPYTYSQYAAKHPVFYWKDPFGRYVRFASYDFIATGGCGKPAIYLYPTSEMAVNVKVNVDGQLEKTIPAYNTTTGWDVIAKPNGILSANNSDYDYLFWDGQFNQNMTKDDGFMIAKDELDNKLQNILDQLGFNNKENSQFREYWIPKMQKENNPYYFVTFLDEKAMDIAAPLTVSPKPDTYKRYFMLYKGEDKEREVKAPEIEKFVRNGFTLFEWGGAKI